ncbi:chitinase, partial [Kitasatospora cinereorecta]
MERALPPPSAVTPPGAAPAPTHRRRRRRSTAAAALAALGLLAGAVAAVNAGQASAATDALGSNWYASAPYLMPEDNNPPDPAAVMDATGQKAFQLAFIL